MERIQHKRGGQSAAVGGGVRPAGDAHSHPVSHIHAQSYCHPYCHVDQHANAYTLGDVHCFANCYPIGDAHFHRQPDGNIYADTYRYRDTKPHAFANAGRGAHLVPAGLEKPLEVSAPFTTR